MRGRHHLPRPRAFKLTAINKNKTIVKLPNGQVMAKHGTSKDMTGAIPLEGNQFRYIYVIDKEAKLAVPSIPSKKSRSWEPECIEANHAHEAQQAVRRASSPEGAVPIPTYALNLYQWKQ